MTTGKRSGAGGKSKKLKLNKETVRDLDVRRPVKGASGGVCQPLADKAQPTRSGLVMCR